MNTRPTLIGLGEDPRLTFWIEMSMVDGFRNPIAPAVHDVPEEKLPEIDCVPLVEHDARIRWEPIPRASKNLPRIKIQLDDGIEALLFLAEVRQGSREGLPMYRALNPVMDGHDQLICMLRAPLTHPSRETR